MKINLFMKGKMFIIGVLIVTIMNSCNKDDGDGILIQDHNDSEMMSILHSMMRSMDSLTMTNDPDNDFARIMKVHHKGGIEMSDLVMQKGNNPVLNELASQMTSQNLKEIASLDSFLVVHSPVVNESRFREQAEKAMEIMSNNADLQLLTGNVDHDFAILLIQHHVGAIDLFDLEIQFGISSGLKLLAGKMKIDQLKEIELLQDWLLK